MSQRYLGGVITANPTTPTMTTESGVWTLEQQFQYSSVWSPKIVGNSVRLRSSASAYFNRTPAVASNRKTWTWSGWVKRGSVSANGTLFAARTGVGATYLTMVLSSLNDFRMESNSETAYPLYKTDALFRDPSAWYHFVIALDMTQATSTNRLKVWVNGVLQTAASYNVPAQNTDLAVNSTETHLIGQQASGGYFDGYLAEINFIDGQALTPASFGAFDSTGVWQPLPYTGTYGTNGFYLTFADNSGATATTIGKDYSGNGNNWTPNNISVTAGSTYDSMLDVPTLWADGGNGRGNYAVLNPLSNGLGNAPSNANLRLSGVSGVTTRINSTIGVSSGKWYFEATLTTASDYNSIGIGQNNITNQYPGNDALSYAQTLERATSINNNVQPSYGTAFGTGDVFMCAFDLDNNKLFFGRNGTWFGSSDPAAGTNPVYTLAAGTYNAIARPNPSGFGSGGVVDFNFGQRPFAYTPPTGFKALNTLNLPDPTIMNGAQYMAATTYTGNGGTQTVANSGGFAPDFVWIKNRGTATDHGLFDTVRGATKRLASNLTSAETTEVNSLTAFTSTGFTVGATQDFNQNGVGLVGWQWLAGRGTTSSNTSGSITSTTSVSTTAGFSVLRYTGNGTSGATIGHGLGVTPKMYILKRRDAGGYNWIVQTTIIDGSLDYLFLNTTAAKGDSGDTPPTSSVISVSGNADVNASGGTYVAYCFAQVAGYSAFGSYTGNGSADGPFVYLGFRPRFVMIKRTDTAEAWTIVDTSRTTSNTNSVQYLIPNSSGAEFTDTNSDYDILSNGLKFRDSGSLSNGSGGTYIYACFAENPFKIARAR